MSEAITREEKLLNAIATGETPDIIPITRKEKYLRYLAGVGEKPIKPVTRKEMLLDAIAKKEKATIKPVTREEQYLRFISGVGEKPNKPITRKEMLLDKIGGGSEPVYYTIRFLDGDIVLQSSQVAYGEMPVYTGETPEKDEYAFVGWTPEIVAVTGDADYQVKWVSTSSKTRKLIDRTITTAESDTATIIGGNYAFSGCSQLTTVNFPLVTTINPYSFQNCSQLTTANFPLVTSISMNAFKNCSKLTTLILRSETMATISGTNVFNSTPIASKTGYIYVPRALLDDTDSTKDYRQATNWSTYSTQFRILEEWTVDGTITGELDWDKINAAA